MKSLQDFIARHTHTTTPARLYCPEHGEYDGIIRQLPAGAPEPSPCPVCQERRQAELDAERQRQATAAAQRAWEEQLEAAGVPRRFWARSFENYTTTTPEQQRAWQTAHRYAERFEAIRATGTCLVFCGAPGTGKTHLACAIVQHLLASGYRAEFSGVYRCLRRIKNTWRPSSPEHEQEVIHHYAGLDLLVLDEVGLQFGSATETLLLFEILNGRYEAVLPTLLISNLTAPELETYLGARLLDRLRENGGALVPFTWASARGAPT